MLQALGGGQSKMILSLRSVRAIQYDPVKRKVKNINAVSWYGYIRWKSLMGSLSSDIAIFHLTLVRMAKIKNTDDSLCWKGCGTRNTPSLLVGMKTWTAALEVSGAVSQNTGNQFTIRLSYTTLGHIPKRCSIIPQGHLFHVVHSSVICNSQNLETT